MTWSNLPATQTTDWTDADFLAQFAAALNERKPWTPIGDADLGIAVGDAAIPFLQSCQSRLQALVPYFMDASRESEIEGLSIVPTPVGFGLPVNINYKHTLATWRSEAGLNAAGFTRKYPREIDTTGDAGADTQRARLTTTGRLYDHNGSAWNLSEDQTTPADTLTAYGLMATGDFIGPWVFNELQAGIQALTTLISNAEIRNVAWGGDGPFESDTTYAAAKASAEADYAVATGSPDYFRVLREASLSSNGLYFRAQQLGYPWNGLLRFISPAFPVGQQFDFRVYTSTYPTAELSTESSTTSFDDLGLGLVDGEFVQTGDGTHTITSASPFSYQVPWGLGSVTESDLPDWPDQPAAGTALVNACETNSFVIVADPDFAYA